MRKRAFLESDVAPPPAAEAEFCAQRLTGCLSGGAKWGVAQGLLGVVVQKLRNGREAQRSVPFSGRRREEKGSVVFLSLFLAPSLLLITKLLTRSESPDGNPTVLGRPLLQEAFP